MTVLIIVVVFVILYIGTSFILLTRDNPKLFKRAVKSYAKLDSTKLPPEGSIILTGSSIMKYWKTCESDLSPLPVVNRAIAGTKINEINYWTEQLVTKYKPSAVVLYAGSNDIQGFKPRTALQVFEGFKTFVQLVRMENPSLQVFYLSINPSPSFIRWKHWNKVKDANNLIHEFCHHDEHLGFIDITEQFLNEQGKPRREYYTHDKIHLKSGGYNVWKEAVMPVLEEWNSQSTVV